MSCKNKYNACAQELASLTGVPPASQQQKCPHCGWFMTAEGSCVNLHCQEQKDGNIKQPGETLLPVSTEYLTSLGNPQKAIQPITGDAVTPLDDAFIEQARINGFHGARILGGGDDIEDMTMTFFVLSGAKPDEERGLLLCKVRADLPLSPGQSSAEQKLLEALALGEPKTVQVTEPVTRQGRLPYDSQQQIYENLVKAAKSLAYHFGPSGDGQLAAHVETELEAVSKALSGAPESAQEMVAHYQAALADLQDCLARAKSGDKAQWKKPQFVTPFEGTYQEEIVKTVTVPPDPDAAQAGLPVLKEKDLVPNIIWGDWKGDWKELSDAGTVYRISLGDGWEAAYYPHEPGKGVAFAQQGTLMIISPAGNVNPAEAVYRLRQLNLDGRLASRDDEEYLYLNRQAWVMGLATTPEYKAIMSWSEKDTQQMQTLIGQYVSALQDLPDDQDDQTALAQELALRAQHQIKLERRDRLLNLIAQKMNLTVDQVRQHPNYMKSTDSTTGLGGVGGYRVWHRLDTGAAHKRRIVHHITGDYDNLIAVAESGVLYSTYRRRHSGIQVQGSTLSPNSDMHTGGASYVFARVSKSGKTGVGIIWNFDTLAARTDWYAYNGDHYGVINPNNKSYWIGPVYTTDPDRAAQHEYSQNEIMFKNGISLIDYPPVAIVAGTQTRREKVLEALSKNGITHLGGKPVEKIVVV